MAIPFFILKTFPLRRREWYGIAFVFSLGLICIVASIVRYVFLYRFIAGDGHIRSLPSQQNVIVITSELEGVIAVWAACLPALRALITRRQSRVEGSAGRSRSHSEGAGGTLGSIVLSQAAANSASRRSKGYDASIAPNNGNIGLAVGFGYGAYDPSRDEELAVARGQGLISPVHNHTLDHPRGWQTDYKRASSNYEIEAVDSDREGSDVELRDSIGARTYGLKSPDRPVFRDLR